MAQVTTTKGWSYIKGVELQEIQAEILNSEDTDTSDLQSKPIPWKKLKNLEEVETLSFPDNCLTLDMTKHITTSMIICRTGFTIFSFQMSLQSMD